MCALYWKHLRFILQMNEVYEQEHQNGIVKERKSKKCLRETRTERDKKIEGW